MAPVCEAQCCASLRLGCPDFAIVRFGVCYERFEQLASGCGHVSDGSVERGLVRQRRPAEAGNLADELKRRRPDFVVTRRWLEIEERCECCGTWDQYTGSPPGASDCRTRSHRIVPVDPGGRLESKQSSYKLFCFSRQSWFTTGGTSSLEDSARVSLLGERIVVATGIPGLPYRRAGPRRVSARRARDACRRERDRHGDAGDRAAARAPRLRCADECDPRASAHHAEERRLGLDFTPHTWRTGRFRGGARSQPDCSRRTHMPAFRGRGAAEWPVRCG